MRVLQHLPLLIAILLLMTVTSCSQPDSDESALRDEFEIPSAARVVSFKVQPEKPGWFGREGLKIDIAFQLSDANFREYAARATASGKWRSLPISEIFLRRMAAIETAKRLRIDSYRMSGETPAPEGSVYNPTDAQMLKIFVESLPFQPANGLFQIRRAGTDIMRAPKSVYEEPDQDLNDFMLAMLDTDRKQIIIKVSTSY
jgi:hypothetical protein